MTRKTRALGILAYVVLLAVVFESLTRLALSIPRFTNRLPVTEEQRYRNSWLQRHRYAGKEIFYDFDVHDPSKGWSAKPGLTDRVVFDHKVLNTNSRGLRGKREYAYEKRPGTPRIIVFGDSFTFGDEVSDDETYCHYLQEMLPQAEVINMGVHGYGHDQMLILLREEGVKYQPDVVVLGFIALDMERNVLAFRDYAKPKFVLRDGELALATGPIPPPEETLAHPGPRSRALGLVSALWERFFLKPSGLYERKVQKITTAILAEFAAEARRVGATPVFVYLPVKRDLSTPGTPPGEEYLLSTCRTIGDVRCFSARPFVAERVAGELPFMSFGHWQPSLHRTVAEAIHAYLVDQGLVSQPAGQTSRP